MALIVLKLTEIKENYIKRIIVYELFIIFIYFMFATSTWAKPAINTIDGTVGHMQSITINGSGFGVKSLAKPYLWAPFNKGSINPSDLGIITSWSQIESMEFNSNEGVGGTGCAKASDGSGTWTLMVEANGFGWNDLNQKMYLFRKTKENFDTASTNWKIWRLWAAGNKYPNVYINTGSCCSNISVESVNGGSGGWFDSKAARGSVNEWRTEEIIFKSNSSVNLSDGIIKMFVNGKKVADIPYYDYSKKTLRMNDGSGSMIMNYVVHGVKANVDFPSHYRNWADDVYLDTNWARVMIGNASTWAASTHKEIQIPYAWSNTSISVVQNMGAFVGKQQVYLYVVDANGNVNTNGYSIVIGGK